MGTIILNGFMATGKTTVGKLVAQSLGVPFVDTDERIAAEAGTSIAELFASEGEAAFRERERTLIAALLADSTPRVIAVGGGALLTASIRHEALDKATVVTLRATPETICERAAAQGQATRPLLGAPPSIDRARDMLAMRQHAYAECHASLDTDGVAAEVLERRVAEVAERNAVCVPLGDRSYAVEFGHNEPSLLTRAISDLDPSSVIVVADENVHRVRNAWIDQALVSCKCPIVRITMKPGESNKVLSSVERIWTSALGAGIDRQALVVAYGGGVVGDVAGFVAATLLRGLRFVQVPTTLLAMVDSSVGGKTGFDHAAGKNLIGAFLQPSRVLVDTAHLDTLSGRERNAGLAEIVKVALVRDAALFDMLETEAPALARGDSDVLREVVRRSVRAKASVVREDEREHGVRALLNLGHTLGHALEANGEYSTLLHGEAVSIGMVVELGVAERLGIAPAGMSTRVAALLAKFSLPTRVEAFELREAWPYVFSDKKRTRTELTFPVVSAPGQGRTVRVELGAFRTMVLGR